MKKIKLFLVISVVAITCNLQAQVAINTNGAAPDNSAMLDVNSTAKGILIPRVALTGIADATTISSPATSLLVYNTATAGTTPNNVTPGYYYWDATVWQRLQNTLPTPSNDWTLLGNVATTNGTNFIGTTDAQSLDFRTNNIIRTRITQKGQIEVLNTGNSVFIGEGAGTNDDLTANNNNFIGYYAGNANTTGSDNTANGYASLIANSSGINNTANGSNSLYTNTTGSYNTANGGFSLYANIAGNNNTANGYAALFKNTGTDNTANGANSLYSNIGGSENTANGYASLYANTSGIYNTANGSNSLRYNTTGQENVANGYASLYTNTTGNYNTANGANSLYLNSTGAENTASGYHSLFNNSAGSYNTAFGVYASNLNTAGNYNTANGYHSLENNTVSKNTANGAYALNQNTTGTNNTAVGFKSLYDNATGIENTAVGVYAGANSAGTNYSNTTALGYNAKVTGANQIRLGDNNVTSIGGIVGWTNLSDGRFKKDIKENVVGLNFIMKLKPVTYHLNMTALNNYFKTPVALQNKATQQAKGKQLQTGFVAQEVEAAAKASNFDFNGVDAPKNAKDYYGLRYAEFVVPLVKATQQQQQMIVVLKQKVKQLEMQNQKVVNQQKEINQLKVQVKQLLKAVKMQ